MSDELMVVKIVVVLSHEAEQGRVCVCSEMGSRLLQHRSWRTTRGCGGLPGTGTTFYCFFFFLKSMTSSGAVDTAQKPAFTPPPNLCKTSTAKNSQHTERHNSRTETRSRSQGSQVTFDLC